MPHHRCQLLSPHQGCREIIAHLIKYVIEGGIVAVVAYLLPRKKMKPNEIIMIALIASSMFAIFDLYAPTVGSASRQGIGFGIGSSLVGFIQFVQGMLFKNIVQPKLVKIYNNYV
jgi:ABC-type Co2+ transport system permease subunit